MQLREIMERPVVTIEPTESARAAWTRMRRRGIRHLVVTEDSSIVGVISERDLGGRDGADVRRGSSVSDLMSPGAVTVDPVMTLDDAAELMRKRRVGSLPVVDNDELVGIVTATDVFDELGRTRSRGTARRTSTKQAFAAKMPRSAKRTAGRTTAEQVPANIRAFGTELAPDERTEIRQQLGSRLGKFAHSIERVTVRVQDVNGPRGGVDKACRIKVVLSGMPSVVVEEHAATMKQAFRAALGDVERAVKRTLDRSRTKPKRTARKARSRR